MEQNITVPEKFNTKTHRIEGNDEIQSNAEFMKRKQEYKEV